MNNDRIRKAITHIDQAKQFIDLAARTMGRAQVELEIESRIASDADPDAILMLNHKSEQCAAATKEINRAHDAASCIEIKGLMDLECCEASTHA